MTDKYPQALAWRQVKGVLAVLRCAVHHHLPTHELFIHTN